jgi:hypothetical protein
VLTEIAITKAAYDLASLRTVRLEISSIKNQDKHFTSPPAKLIFLRHSQLSLGLKSESQIVMLMALIGKYFMLEIPGLNHLLTD